MTNSSIPRKYRYESNLNRFAKDEPGTAFPNPSCALNHLSVLLKASRHLGWDQECTFLTSSGGMQCCWSVIHTLQSQTSEHISRRVGSIKSLVKHEKLLRKLDNSSCKCKILALSPDRVKTKISSQVMHLKPISDGSSVKPGGLQLPGIKLPHSPGHSSSQGHQRRCPMISFCWREPLGSAYSFVQWLSHLCVKRFGTASGTNPESGFTGEHESQPLISTVLSSCPPYTPDFDPSHSAC